MILQVPSYQTPGRIVGSAGHINTAHTSKFGCRSSCALLFPAYYGRGTMAAALLSITRTVPIRWRTALPFGVDEEGLEPSKPKHLIYSQAPLPLGTFIQTVTPVLMAKLACNWSAVATVG